MDWSQSQWLLWVGVAITAGVAEVFTLNLVFAMIAGGALVAAVAAAVTGNVVLATALFAVSSGVLLVGARPALLHYVRTSAPPALMHSAALVGRTAQVLAEVSSTDGRVKLDGETWSARLSVPGGVLEVGSLVQVVQIDGATAVVTSARSESSEPPEPPALSR